MEAFATTADLSLRMQHVFTEAEEPLAEATLLDATAYIQSQLDRYGIEVDPEDEVQARNLLKVCCSVSKRTLAPQIGGARGGTDFSAAPLNGYMQTAGSFTEQFQFANPMGDYYLTKSEQESLGIGRMRFRTIPVHIPMEERL